MSRAKTAGWWPPRWKWRKRQGSPPPPWKCPTAATIIEPIQDLKVNHLGNHNPRLHTDEILVALSICAATNPTAELAMQALQDLRGCEVHSSVILSSVDENTFRKLGINLTCEPRYQSKQLYHK